MKAQRLGRLFMVLGLILIAAALLLLVNNSNENQSAKESAAVIMEAVRAEISELEKVDIPEDPFEEDMTVKDIDGYGYIGYLSVPSLSLELPVMSEWNYDRLKMTACRYYGSTKTNNLVIAAHNYRYHFGYIGNLNQGDVVLFTDMDARTYSYRVESIELLSAVDVDKVKDTGDDLILYTCNYSGNKRITVRCRYTENK